MFPTGCHHALYAAENSGSGTARCPGRPPAVGLAHLPPLLQPRAARPAAGTATLLPSRRGSRSHQALRSPEACCPAHVSRRLGGKALVCPGKPNFGSQSVKQALQFLFTRKREPPELVTTLSNLGLTKGFKLFDHMSVVINVCEIQRY